MLLLIILITTLTKHIVESETHNLSLLPTENSSTDKLPIIDEGHTLEFDLQRISNFVWFEDDRWAPYLLFKTLINYFHSHHENEDEDFSKLYISLI